MCRRCEFSSAVMIFLDVCFDAFLGIAANPKFPGLVIWTHMIPDLVNIQKTMERSTMFDG